MAQLRVHLPCWRHTISSDPCEATSLPSDLVSEKCDSGTVNRVKTDGILLITSELGTSFCTQGKLPLIQLPLTPWGKQAVCVHASISQLWPKAWRLDFKDKSGHLIPFQAQHQESQAFAWIWSWNAARFMGMNNSSKAQQALVVWYLLVDNYNPLSLLVDVAWYWSFIWLVVLYTCSFFPKIWDGWLRKDDLEPPTTNSIKDAWLVDKKYVIVG